MISSDRHRGKTRAGTDRSARAAQPPDPAVMVAAVRDDVRQTLRMAWLDPPIEAAAEFPAFFTAAWSAIRPNVGKSFLHLARGLRAEALDTVRSVSDPPDLRKGLEDKLTEGELRPIEESARAAHLAAAKTQIVVHALHRAARGDRIAGTGDEEPPIRRGVPEWQHWLAISMIPEPAKSTLDDATRALGIRTAPAALRFLARSPYVLASAWSALKPVGRTESWKSGTGKLRRAVLAGMSSMPHPIELQWTPLKARGFRQEERLDLVQRLAAYDREMSIHTMVAAFIWAALGGPEMGSES
jgi:hypothetical protein